MALVSRRHRDFGHAGTASADSITFGGAIIQSSKDGTGPAVKNPALNRVADVDTYSVTINFAGSAVTSISGPGKYNLTGGTLILSDPAAPASETSFGSISLTVFNDGLYEDFSLLAC